MTKSRPCTTYLAVALAALLGGCATTHVSAGWYLLNTEKSEQDGNVTAEFDDIYVLLLNRGEPVTIDELTVNGGPIRLASPLELKRGEFKLVPIGLAQTSRCFVPTSVAIRIVGRRKPSPLKVTGTLPSALPLEWTEKCRPSST